MPNQKTPNNNSKPAPKAIVNGSLAATPTTKNLSLSRPLIVSVSIALVCVLVLVFLGGFVTGRFSAKHRLEDLAFSRRQLTENLDRPISERPLLKNIPEHIRQQFNKHGLIGSVVEVNDDAILVDTPEGVRSVLINADTKIFLGNEKNTGSIEDLKSGVKVLSLGKPTTDGQKENQSDQLMAAIIVIDPEHVPPMPGMRP